MLNRLTALLLCFAVLAPMAPAALVPSASAAEGEVPYYQAPMEKLTSWDVLSGYPDGELHPERPVTRAEFVAMVNRAYGYDEVGETPFTDVPEGAWFADDIGIAYNMGYFSGTTDTTASPNAELTREQAMVLLAHNMRLEPVPGEVTQFIDGRDFSNYSKGYVKAAVEQGLISGFPDGSFQPRSPITRGQMATILSNALGTLMTGGGEQALGSVYGNLTINQAGTTLQDTTIAGNLYISGGLGLGAVNLENVKVLGDIIVSGGGEVESGQDSVILRNVQANNLLVDSLGGQYLSLRAEGDTVIDQTDVRTSAYLQDRTPAGLGLLNISLKGRDGLPSNFTLSGNLEAVTNRTPGSDLVVSRGTVKSLTMDEAALGAGLTVDTNTTVKTLNLDTATSVQGVGDVGTLNVSTAGSSTTMLPDSIVVRPGVNVMVGNTNMDAALAEESSQTPRLLAGYPSAKNIAPTSASAVFSANKPGTVYWAVSSITDGSVSESELLAPSSYGSPALKSGNLAAKTSSTELSAAVSGLTKGGTYYLSAMLVDARGAHSPVKTISFETPDDSVPNFASGSPAMSKLSNTYAQASVTTTKNCDIHWVLYAKGSTAPTANDFKSGSLGGALDSGVVSGAVKNLPEYIDVGHRNYETDTGTLEELASYDLYFWLNDADNSKSSAVKKLSFTTVDKTPPVFVTDPLNIGKFTATSIPLTGQLNESGKIFWALVEQNANFPSPISGSTEPTAPLDSTEAKMQVESGTGSLKNGSVSTKGTEPFTFSLNLSGLQPETSYDLYYVAKDKANNYSKVVKKLSVHTLDNTPPRVWQEFTRYPNGNTTTPLADTNIRIVFNESVQQHPEGYDLLTLYQTSTNASLPAGEREDAKNTLTKALQKMIRMGKGSSTVYGELDPVPERTLDEAPIDWVIDYSKATVTTEKDETTGRNNVVITFPTKDSPNDSALNLGSGSTYHFRIENLSDAAGNTLTTDLPGFTTASATVEFKAFSAGTITKVLKTDADGEPELDSNGKPVYDETVSIPADVVFTMDPNSTATMDPNICWDMLIWASKTVEFDLYWTDYTSGTPVGQKWTKLGHAGIRFTTNTKEPFVGTSLFSGITTYPADEEGRTRPPIHSGKNGDYDLDQDKTYAFALHITSYNGSPESNRDAWDADMKFRFDIASGEFYPLSTATNTTSPTFSYSGMMNRFSSPTDVWRISTPEEFEMPFQLAVQAAPEIKSGYPRLTDLQSYGVNYDVQLDNNGTIYYVVAKLNDVIPTLVDPDTDVETQLNLSDFLDSNGKVDQTKVEETFPISGIFPPESTVQDKVYASDPEPGRVSNAEFWAGLDAVRVGTAPYNGVTAHIQVGTLQDPLDSETTYLIYFATEKYPHLSKYVEVYTFTTPAPERPQITVNPSGTQVGITTSSASCTYWKLLKVPTGGETLNSNLTALFKNDLRTLTSAEKNKYLDEMGSYATDKGISEDTISTADVIEYYVDELDLTAAVANSNDAQPTYANITCLQAMATPFPTGRSLFDEFSGGTVRQGVWNHIRSQGTNDGVTMDISIPHKDLKVGEETDAPSAGKVTGTDSYILLISAINHDHHNDNPNTISTDFIAFRAYYYLRDRGATPIQVSDVSGLQYSQDTKTFSGTLRITFTSGLYFDPEKISGGRNQYLPVVYFEGGEATQPGLDPLFRNVVLQTFSWPDSFELSGADVTSTFDSDDPTQTDLKAIQTISFEAQDGVRVGDTIAATANSPSTNPGLCSAVGARPVNKNNIPIQLRITIAGVDEATGQVLYSIPEAWDARG